MLSRWSFDDKTVVVERPEKDTRFAYNIRANRSYAKIDNAVHGAPALTRIGIVSHHTFCKELSGPCAQGRAVVQQHTRNDCVKHDCGWDRAVLMCERHDFSMMRLVQVLARHDARDFRCGDIPPGSPTTPVSAFKPCCVVSFSGTAPVSHISTG